MSKRVIDLRSQAPLLDIVSYARGRGPLTPAQPAYIARTVRRVPEVVVKVSGGARTLAGVKRYLKYIEKKGVSGLETDMETRVGGKGFARDMVGDWDLDLEALNHYSKKMIRGKPPKLVHNIIFSMPAGTSPTAVLGAVRKLALNEWAFQHRYAMALHTDTPRPHVHVAVKAMSEQGIRLNIKKSTLRQWRAQFAANLRDYGIAANATERSVRGELRTGKPTGVYRASLRGESSHMESLRRAALNSSDSQRDSDRIAHLVLHSTRKRIVAGYRAVALDLHRSGYTQLATDIQNFIAQMRPVAPEREVIREDLAMANRTCSPSTSTERAI